MLLQIWVRRSLGSHISCIQTIKTKLGKYGFANKGAISIRFCLDGHPIIVTDVHLQHKAEAFEFRTEQFKKYLAKIPHLLCPH